MGMGIGGTNSGRNVIQIKNRDGSVAATVSISKPAKKKAKRLNYSFKAISKQIMSSKTSNSASKAITKARGTIAGLLQKMNTGEYDDKEIELAIAHAKKMERIARKRVSHLKQEEEIKRKGKSAESDEELTEEVEETEDAKEVELSEEELRELMEEYQRLMREAAESQQEEMAVLDEEEMAAPVEDMDEDDLERLKKKHRSDELRELADADMKYLKALFGKLEKERQELSSGSAADLQGVTLELSGLQMPLESAPMPAMAEGGNIDLAL